MASQSLDTDIEVLSEVPFFAGFTEDQLRLIAISVTSPPPPQRPPRHARPAAPRAPSCRTSRRARSANAPKPRPGDAEPLQRRSAEAMAVKCKTTSEGQRRRAAGRDSARRCRSSRAAQPPSACRAALPARSAPPPRRRGPRNGAGSQKQAKPSPSGSMPAVALGPARVQEILLRHVLARIFGAGAVEAVLRVRRARDRASGRPHSWSSARSRSPACRWAPARSGSASGATS